MAGETKDGLSTALETVGIGDPPGDDAEQLSLIDQSDDERNGMALAFGDMGGKLDERRGPGRPAGSKNKRTEEWLEFLQSRFQSPLVALASTWTADTEKLAKELSISKGEAFEIQQSAAKAALPYWHQKQPMAVEIDEKGRASVHFHVSPGLANTINQGAVGDGAIVIEGELVDPDREKENDDKSNT